MHKTFAAALLLVLLAAPAYGWRIECIHAGSLDGSDFSATAIQTDGRAPAYNIELYSDAEADVGPDGGQCISGGTTTTCAGFDTASVEVFWRTDRNAPFLLMENTTATTTAVNFGRVLTSKAQIRLKVTTIGDACIYFAVNSNDTETDVNREIQDGESLGSWALANP